MTTQGRELFFKTLKTEEVNGKDHKNLRDARSRFGAVIENYYNARRLLSALGYKPPEEFEVELNWADDGQCFIGAALSPN